MKLLPHHREPTARPRRVLVPFTRGNLEPTVLAAAIRIAKAEGRPSSPPT
jgi:hypothetical protein